MWSRGGELIRLMTKEDWPAVKAIYEAGLATRLATFERKAPSWQEWDASHHAEHRLVAGTTPY